MRVSVAFGAGAILVGASPCTVSLTKQLSVFPCTEGVNYGCTGAIGDAMMWTRATNSSNGCRGVFDCDGTPDVKCDVDGIGTHACKCGGTPAGLRLPSFLSHNMVLQRGNASLWGWATPSETVKVTVSGVNGAPVATASAVAAAGNGAWRVSLLVSALPNTTVSVTSSAGAGRPGSGRSSLALTNVAFGDVFLCSGQSNSECAVLLRTSRVNVRLCAQRRIALLRP
jgi:hypothetical protein